MVCHLEGLVIVGDRLAISEGLGRLLRRLAEILKSLGPLLSLRKMVGEYLVLLGQPVCVEFLDGPADEPMQLLPPPYQQ